MNDLDKTLPLEVKDITAVDFDRIITGLKKKKYVSCERRKNCLPYTHYVFPLGNKGPNYSQLQNTKPEITRTLLKINKYENK